jgi:hypothetical protein
LLISDGSSTPSPKFSDRILEATLSKLTLFTALDKSGTAEVIALLILLALIPLELDSEMFGSDTFGMEILGIFIPFISPPPLSIN